MSNFEELRARKHNTPLLDAATAEIKDPTARYGYSHVQKSFGDRYFCNYKGLSTGLHDTPMLAAYELLKIAKKQGVIVESRPDIEYYPECFANVKFNVAEIEYLKDSTVKAMYKGIKTRVYRGKRVFTCDIVLDGIAYRSHPHDTPMEAAYAVHKGKAKVKEYVFVPGPEPTTLPDLDAIKYMQVGSGYRFVFQVAPGLEKYQGRYSIYGQEYKTSICPTMEHAAWIVHCLTKDAPQMDTWEKKIADQTTGLKAIKSRVVKEYAIARKALVEHAATEGIKL